MFKSINTKFDPVVKVAAFLAADPGSFPSNTLEKSHT
jgi:hypothetical protein